MEIQILSKETIASLEGKRICCWGMLRDNLEELLQEFDVLDQLECIVEDNVKKQGITMVAGKKLPVISSEEFGKQKQSEMLSMILLKLTKK